MDIGELCTREVYIVDAAEPLSQAVPRVADVMPRAPLTLRAGESIVEGMDRLRQRGARRAHARKPPALP